MKPLYIFASFLLLLTTFGKAQKNSALDYNNQFALNFLKQISASEKGNIFFSPVSLSLAMGMTFVGAKGETQTQISNVFHFPKNNKKFHSQHGEISKLLSSRADSIQLNIVNTLYAERSYSIKISYTESLQKFYSTSVKLVDFINKYEESRVLINDNISKSTNEKIKNLLPSGSVSNLTRLVLTNAVFFKADWRIKFQKERTGEANFYTAPQNPIRCQMMGIKGVFDYFENDKLQALELPYAGNNFTMLLILPRHDNPLDELIKGINSDYLNSIINGLSNQEITISVPRYKLTAGYQLKQLLSDMGMPQPFTDNANFSRMTTRADLKISDVFHKAFIEVNEQGTEAAAATAVVIAMKSVGNDKFFVANRPFIFLIREKKSGSILFMGRIVDPTKSE